VNRLSPVMSSSYAEAEHVPDNGQTDRAQAWRLLLVPAVVTATLSRVIDGKGHAFGCSGSFVVSSDLTALPAGIALAAGKTQHRCLTCECVLANIGTFYLQRWSWQLPTQSLWQPHTASGQGPPAHTRCTTLCSKAKSPSQLWWGNGSATIEAWPRYSQRWSVLHILPCLLVPSTFISFHHTGVHSVACCPFLVLHAERYHVICVKCCYLY